MIGSFDNLTHGTPPLQRALAVGHVGVGVDSPIPTCLQYTPTHLCTFAPTTMSFAPLRPTQRHASKHYPTRMYLASANLLT